MPLDYKLKYIPSDFNCLMIRIMCNLFHTLHFAKHFHIYYVNPYISVMRQSECDYPILQRTPRPVNSIASEGQRGFQPVFQLQFLILPWPEPASVYPCPCHSCLHIPGRPPHAAILLNKGVQMDL